MVRREFLSATAASALAIAADARITSGHSLPRSNVPRSDGRMPHPHDGSRNTIVESVAIRAAVSRLSVAVFRARQRDARRQLRGRLITGIIVPTTTRDIGNRTGYHTMLERAIASRRQQRCRQTKGVPANEFITRWAAGTQPCGRRNVCRRKELDDAVHDVGLYAPTFKDVLGHEHPRQEMFRKPAVVVAENGDMPAGCRRRRRCSGC